MNDRFSYFEDGHFHSPIHSKEDIKQNDSVDGQTNNAFGYCYKAAEPNNKNTIKSLAGININETHQLALLEAFSAYHHDIDFAQTRQKVGYYYQNDYFTYGDAITLQNFIRHFKPTNIIEVGSGFSSAVMVETQQKHLGYQLNLTFIEPYQSERLARTTQNSDVKYNLIEQPVQQVPLEIFEQLNDGDILFIDSSHVAKFASDVTHLLFEVLPRLKSGVFIHFHDILWPFEYPKQWLEQGWAWNEAYMLRAFLMNNDKYQIEYFNSYLGNVHTEQLKKYSPLSLKDTGGSLWLRKS